MKQRPMPPRTRFPEHEIFREGGQIGFVVALEHDLEPAAFKLAARSGDAGPAEELGIFRFGGTKDGRHEAAPLREAAQLSLIRRTRASGRSVAACAPHLENRIKK